MVKLKSSRLQIFFAVSTAEFHEENFGGLPRSAPSAALYLELGIWPIRYEKKIKQLLFLKCVLNKKADNPCLPAYLEMLKFKDETKWGNGWLLTTVSGILSVIYFFVCS